MIMRLSLVHSYPESFTAFVFDHTFSTICLALVGTMQKSAFGRQLKFSGLHVFCCLCVDSLVATFRYLKPAFVSEVLDCFAIKRYRLSRCSVFKVCRLAKSQAYKPEERINQHLLKTYKFICELFKIAGVFSALTVLHVHLLHSFSFKTFVQRPLWFLLTFVR